MEVGGAVVPDWVRGSDLDDVGLILLVKFSVRLNYDGECQNGENTYARYCTEDVVGEETVGSWLAGRVKDALGNAMRTRKFEKMKLEPAIRIYQLKTIVKRSSKENPRHRKCKVCPIEK